MANNLELLAGVLDEKRAVMEELKMLLLVEQGHIADLDVAGLEADGTTKERILAQLNVLNNLCRDHLLRNGTSVDLKEPPSLSAVLQKADLPHRERLQGLQQKITATASDVVQLNKTNAELLQDSLSMTNRLVDFFNRILGGSKTYASTGQMVQGEAEGRLLRQEI